MSNTVHEWPFVLLHSCRYRVVKIIELEKYFELGMSISWIPQQNETTVVFNHNVG